MKKLFSSFLDAAVAATAFAGLSITASAEDTKCGVLIHISGAENDTELTAASSTIADAGISFDSDTKTIFFEKDTELLGLPNHYGAAFVCTNGSKDVLDTGLTINIPSGITVTCDNRTVSGLEYAYGIYLNRTGDVKVTGGGTLELQCRTDADPDKKQNQDGYCITSYQKGYTLTVDGATFKASGIYGFYNDGNDNDGKIKVTNGGVAELSGTVAAIKGSSAINYGTGATFKAGESADAATKVDALNETAKFVRITTAGTPTGIRIGGEDIYRHNPIWKKDGVTAAYNESTNTLTLSGTGTISGLSGEDTIGCGAAIYAGKSLNIVVEKDADITLKAGPGSGGWNFGLYIYAGDPGDASMTIGGEGKLTVINDYNDNDSVAISPYSTDGKYEKYDLTIKDSVSVTAKCGKQGIRVARGGAGKMRITDKASLTVEQAEQAIHGHLNKEDIYGGKSFAGSMNNGEWDFDKSFTEVASLSIAPATSASYTEDTTGAFVGSDNATGFITTVTAKGNLVIQSIKWNVTSGTETKPLTPQGEKPIITLADGANAVFKVIVSGLKDENAKAVAVVE